MAKQPPKFEAESFKKISLDEMLDYIENYFPEDKAWFKKVAFEDKDGNPVEKYNHLHAVRVFCERYNKDLIPVKKEAKPSPVLRLKNW